MADLRTGLLVTAVLLGLTGCVTGTPDHGRPTARTTTVSPPPVRTDREPITKRFPHLGDVAEVHWQAGAAGTGDSRVPGPTDIRIEALVVLQPGDRVSAVEQYEWQPAPAGWDGTLGAALRPFLPDSGNWQVNEQYAADVRTTKYHGVVYLDTTSGTVYLRVIDG
ncbi:hypothetical protein HUT12_18780 [Verrucosispora sp. NA02020]|nr:hypothetical protein HUT12_18780 [Verrucosispora sp. NA02020]